tara:strand:+ start:533 stop:1609 length:1077 start_codon:yes stop_codon:yes gene_type:complete
MHIFSTLFFLVGCGDDPKDNEASNEPSTEEPSSEPSADVFSEFVNVDVVPAGDQTCFTGSTSIDEATWLTQDVDTSKQVQVPFSGEVIDFETDDPVEEAFVEIWFDGVIDGAPDSTAQSDGGGALSGDLVTCTPYGYRVSTDAALDETKVTMEVPQIDKFGDSIDTEFNSVSSATYAVIPSLLGVSPDPEMGIVAGTASDCNGDAFEGAQVVVRGADGSIPESEVVRYFVENFPNRQQMWTSEDGLWVAINIPVGDWIIEMWVYDEASSGHLLQGTTPVKVFANSINIANVVSGHDDGLLYPDNCLLSSGSEPAGEPAEEPRGEPSGEASSEPAEEPSGEPSGEVNTTDTLRVDHSKE